MCQATLSLAARDLARRPNGACLGGSRRRAISADVNPRTVSCRMVAASGVAISRPGAPSSRRPRGSSLPHHCRTEEDRQRQQRQACRRPLTQHAISPLDHPGHGDGRAPGGSKHRDHDVRGGYGRPPMPSAAEQDRQHAAPQDRPERLPERLEGGRSRQGAGRHRQKSSPVNEPEQQRTQRQSQRCCFPKAQHWRSQLDRLVCGRQHVGEH
jgi:hypothetical protein